MVTFYTVIENSGQFPFTTYKCLKMNFGDMSFEQNITFILLLLLFLGTSYIYIRLGSVWLTTIFSLQWDYFQAFPLISEPQVEELGSSSVMWPVETETTSETDKLNKTPWLQLMLKMVSFIPHTFLAKSSHSHVEVHGSCSTICWGTWRKPCCIIPCRTNNMFSCLLALLYIGDYVELPEKLMQNIETYYSLSLGVCIKYTLATCMYVVARLFIFTLSIYNICIIWNRMWYCLKLLYIEIITLLTGYDGLDMCLGWGGTMYTEVWGTHMFWKMEMEG
jgi:hypothetical protein